MEKALPMEHKIVLLMYRLFLATAVSAVLVYGFCAYKYLWGDRLLAPVQKGMTTNGVQHLVGAPRQIISRTNGTIAWIYNSVWDDAEVYFGPNGRVSAVVTD